ncbi:hypothetical protein [Atopomonas sediminilitoris]|uniref:hypothetical protein n=1 Tax=Atopomonas sediminilitoris TaxID=2919919 RepID=UPI001F4DA12D|nr:hypothetical protein [Atopomonas sediminilitoris]MCJ8170407.1 hypothetical protein [Atopomonas sediminilitoris]
MNAPQCSQALVYFTYGTDCFHIEARFSILTALFRSPERTPTFSIFVYTDSPQYFSDLPVDITCIDAAQLNAWQGPHGYIHRSKHEIMLRALDRTETAIFIDSDTYFTQDPALLFLRTGHNTVLVNVIAEGARSSSNDIVKALAKPIAKLGLDTRHLKQTNSGVMGIHQQNTEILHQSLALMDELYLQSGSHYTMEEFALALATQKNNMQLTQCADLLHHYWSRKTIFRAKVSAFLNNYPAPLSDDRAQTSFTLVTPTLPKPPTYYRLTSKMLAFSLPKAYRQFFIEIRYGLYPYANEFDRACLYAWLDKALNNAEENQLGFDVKPALRSVLRRLPARDCQSVREHFPPSAF